jgi:hypothetical protein
MGSGALDLVIFPGLPIPLGVSTGAPPPSPIDVLTAAWHAQDQGRAPPSSFLQATAG